MSEAIFTPGQEIELDIHGYSSEGAGVGRIRSAVCFTAGALSGEKIRARITAVRKKLLQAELTAVLEAAPARCRPPCPVFGACGGCQLQHAAYAEQLLLKETRVRDALERIGGFSNAPVAPIRGLDEPWRYRNKVTFAVGGSVDKPVIGFHRHRSLQLVGVVDCLLADPAAGRLAAAAVDFCRDAGETAAGRPLVSRVTVRNSLASGEKLIILETRGRALDNGRVIAEKLLALGEGIIGAVNAVAARGSMENGGEEVGLDRRFTPLLGRERITETLDSLRFTVSAGDFFQVNSRQAAALYGRAAALIPAGPGERAVDAYCGLGGFALFLARRAEYVTGLEVDPDAVRGAERIARENGVSNVRYLACDLEKRPDRTAAALRGSQTLVVDPPRRGLSPRFREWCAGIGFKRIIYASCDPATLARDCRAFADQGFSLREVTPFDMFPQTAHVESLALLEQSV